MPSTEAWTRPPPMYPIPQRRLLRSQGRARTLEAPGSAAPLPGLGSITVDPRPGAMLSRGAMRHRKPVDAGAVHSLLTHLVSQHTRGGEAICPYHGPPSRAQILTAGEHPPPLGRRAQGRGSAGASRVGGPRRATQRQPSPREQSGQQLLSTEAWTRPPPRHLVPQRQLFCSQG